MGNFRQKMQNFMMKRNGPDHLSQTMIFTGLGLTIFSLILNLIKTTPTAILASLFNTIGFVLLIVSLFRMLSTNKVKRQAENRRYLAFSEKKKNELHQAKIRFANRKEYKYFKCPNCKVRMRLKRGMGIVTVTCSRCHNSFTQKS